MKVPASPQIETRRAADFLAELRERARAWIPDWDLSDAQGDFGQAVLDVSARFSSEVAERLDQAGDKMRCGFLDWLGVRGEAARPARMPVVFKLSDSAQASVVAVAPIRLQANAGAVPVVFETEKSLTIIPAKLQMIVAADPANDAYFLPPPDLSSLAAIEQLPTQWTVKSFAPAGATALQLMPGVGLSPDVLIELNGRQYTIKTADKDLITIDRPLEAAANKDTEVAKVAYFEPFDPAAANQQEHILYIGDSDLLNVEAAATIGVQNAAGLGSGVKWQYWGKHGTSETVDWQDLTPSTVQNQPGMLLLDKPAGSMEQVDVNGHNARWIRAYAKTVLPGQPPFTASRLAIEINPSVGCMLGPCPPPDGTPSIQADAMANTTPLVLDNLFYPLGKEPHQFDAFYVGSSEAFSKANAKVQLCFEMADRTFHALTAVRGISFGASRVLVGVGRDRALHLLELDPSTGKVSPHNSRPPLYPPSPAFVSGPQPGSAISLDKDPQWRPPVWTAPWFLPGFATAVCAGSTVWVWVEHPFVFPSGWVNFGQIPSVSTPAPDMASLIALNEGGITLFALRESKLYSRVWGSSLDWSEMATINLGATIRLVSIVAVRQFDAAFTEIGTSGMVGIDDNRKLFHFSAAGVCTPLMELDSFDARILPAAVEVGGKRMAAAVIYDPVHASNIELKVFRDAVEVATTIPNRGALDALEPVLDGGTLHILLTATNGNTQSLFDWVPFDAGWALKNELFEVAIDVATAGGAPTEVDGVVAVPGNRADILSATYDATLRVESKAEIDAGVVVSSAFPPLALNDYVIRVDPGPLEQQHISITGVTKDGETLYGLSDGFSEGTTRMDAFPHPTTPLNGTKNGDTWQLDPNDRTTVGGGYIQIGAAPTPHFYRVVDIDGSKLATLALPLPAPLVTGPYIPGWITNGRPAPVMNVVPGSWKADALDRPIGFPDNDPSAQSAKAFAIASNHPTLLALGREFNSTAANPFTYGQTYRFVIEAAFGKWNRDAGGSTNNPELSWEYWNGKGWSRLNLDRDDTLNLQITGPVQFTVPTDIAPSDWAGKTNPWIRARLIGGDYGREKFVTIGTTTTRSTDDIHPPSVVNLTISYQLCTAVLPTFILTSDSGSLVDQSNANRSPSANVEAFVPLAVTLARLLQPTGSGSGAGVSTDPCPPPCNCPGNTTTAPTPAPAAPVATASATAPTPAPAGAGPCLLVGLAGTVSGADVHLLVLPATEHDNTAVAPLHVQAIVANRFTQIVASDGTRALGETGLIEMSFAVPPSTTDIFGQSLVWLGLFPGRGATTQTWRPSIAGMYLNAVFAKSTETLTRELLGSADGSPNLTVTLARPPVLAGTLELRVREPLSDQDRTDLDNRGLLVTDNSDYWVLWKQVDDTADQPAGERVYMLDESTGEIRFGDGLHGMIPPIGRDSIVAFSYQRTEPPTPGSDVVPANGIPARTTLNLVSPVETVESVTTAAESAGGSAPEKAATVLQFGYARLRHRERALTLQDLEDLALESSPWIAQARAFQLSRGRVQVTVVMRGYPLPTLAQIRELRRYLLSLAPAALALPGALTMSPPRLRELRIELSLDVESLDKAAQVSVDVKVRLEALFDTATGNLTHDGWPLGLNPAEDVVASAIESIPGLASIEDVQFFEIDAKGSKLPWPAQIKATDLVVLADDPVRLEFHSLEVAA
jgi:hypothetical protein